MTLAVASLATWKSTKLRDRELRNIYGAQERVITFKIIDFWPLVSKEFSRRGAKSASVL